MSLSVTATPDFHRNILLTTKTVRPPDIDRERERYCRETADGREIYLESPNPFGILIKHNFLSFDLLLYRGLNLLIRLKILYRLYLID